MRNTRLMIGMPEAAVRRPPIAREHAREILAEDGGRIHKSAAGSNRVDRGVGRGERPEPVQRAGHFPPDLVGTHDRTAADLGTQRLVGQGGARRHAGTDLLAPRRRGSRGCRSDHGAASRRVRAAGRTLCAGRRRAPRPRGRSAPPPPRARPRSAADGGLGRGGHTSHTRPRGRETRG